MDIILGKNGQTRDVIEHISSDRILLQLMSFITESKLQTYLHLNYSVCVPLVQLLCPPQAHGQSDIPHTKLNTRLAPSTPSTWTA